MVTVTWKLTDGTEGSTVLEPEQVWSFGRDAASSLVWPEPALSRQALTIRDAGPGPVVFCGQRANGVRVALVSQLGSQRRIDPDTAANLSAAENRVQLFVADDLLLTVDVTFDPSDRQVVRYTPAAAEPD